VKLADQYFVYIVECRDGTYYTGYTHNIRARLKQHNSGKGGHYTSGRYPVTLAYIELCDSKRAAMRREYEIKKLKRHGREKLIQSAAKPEGLKK